MTYREAIRALNEAAYQAAQAARKEGRKEACDLKRIALHTDELVEKL